MVFFYQFTDFDGDDMLGINDLKQVIQRLIGEDNHLSDNDIRQLIQVSTHFFMEVKPFL